MSYANNKGADQPAHPRSLISAFVVRCLDSIICKTLAGFCGCAGRFDAGLVGNSRRHVLSCRGSTTSLTLMSGFACGEKTCLREFPTRPDTNRPAQPQKLASLQISAIESRDIICILSKHRKTRLIRLRECAG